MSAVLQCIEFAYDPRLKRAILQDRSKCMTVRVGWRDYDVGAPVMLACHQGESPWCVKSVVESVQKAYFGGMSAHQIEACGYDGIDDLAESMKGHYPQYKWDDYYSIPVTIVEWCIGQIVGTAASRP